MNRNKIIYYVIGTGIFFLALAMMPMRQSDTNIVIKAFVFITAGVALGLGLAHRALASVFILIPFLALLALSFLR
jgi:hypothetical protein